MSSRLAEYVDPWRLAGVGKRLSGQVKLVDLPRVTELLQSSDGDVEFLLEFFSAEKKRPGIKGFVKSDLVLSCQRCLEPVTEQVNSEVNLMVIEVPEEAELLPEECDPLWVVDGRVKLMDLLEEELLLAVPQVARHPLGECPVDLPTEHFDGETLDSEPVADESATNEHNPFAILAGLKKDD